jgi:hypothetical protein
MMPGMTNKSDLWFILRMAGPRTLAVADSLKDAGFDAWTPIGSSSRRKSRKPGVEAKGVPVMPTYVFARDHHLHELLAEASRPVSAHPAFSVFRWDGRIPLIADRSLDYLRRGEARYLRRVREGQPVKRFAEGERVQLSDGGFAGMSGIVETSKGKFTLVCFPGFAMPIKVATMLLLGDDATQAADLAA